VDRSFSSNLIEILPLFPPPVLPNLRERTGSDRDFLKLAESFEAVVAPLGLVDSE